MTTVYPTIMPDFGATLLRDPEGVVPRVKLDRRTAAQGACLGAAN
ncbi:hypothetical protein [Alterinioella nitratireducens]|jgi:hypothetical protein|nr:hypothetical protein [Alterinioella nitratireducens]|tara:strand:- start:315 stop:449 length:135 start_codon:yes stop_codon:yes gene_type:complete